MILIIKIQKGLLKLNKLQKCIETKRVNTSQSREVIYKIISDSD
jgi:hypothetical protein